ncbi:MAG TPA: cupin domain-containing protein [Puia sp.]|jgi:mannose-6-phosphate isomerase-like protein (cupin superfamily)|nr:cupin domain-containing protein [Puia sp.]
MKNNPIIASPLAGNMLGQEQGDFVIAEWQDPGGSPGPPRFIAPLHVHYKDDEAWYVLEGCLCVRSGDSIIEARPGCAVFVAKGTVHTYWNPLPQKTRYLLIMTPKIHRLIGDIHAMKDRTTEKMKELWMKYDSAMI